MAANANTRLIVFGVDGSTPSKLALRGVAARGLVRASLR
jgi:hypothetical protein